MTSIRRLTCESAAHLQVSAGGTTYGARTHLGPLLHLPAHQSWLSTPRRVDIDDALLLALNGRRGRDERVRVLRADCGRGRGRVGIASVRAGDHAGRRSVLGFVVVCLG